MSEGLSPVEAGTQALTDALGGSGEATPVAETSTPPAPVNIPEPQSSGNPSWQPLLDKIPEGFHSIVRPAFEEWDKGVNKRFEQVHSQYEPLKAYEQFAQHQIAPEQLGQAYQLFQLIQERPEDVYNALAENFGFGGQGLPNDGNEEEEQYDLGGNQRPQEDPRIAQLEQQQQALITGMQQAQQMQAEREADAWVETQINTAKSVLTEKNIPVTDEAMRFILGTAASLGDNSRDNTKAFETAVNAYVSVWDGARSHQGPSASAPPVIPTGGGVPSNRVSPADMDSNGRKQLGAAWLAQALKDG